MKIINFKQEDICYMFKDNQIKIDRSDIWGEPNEHNESLLSYCRTFTETDDNDTAQVIYLYGQGGVGKSFVCREIAEKLRTAPYEDKLYATVVDLQSQTGFEDSLKCLADEMMQQTNKKDLFPRFHLAYYNYKLKSGEKYEQEERSTKWDDLHHKSSFTLAAGAASFLSSFGTVSDIIDLANEGYKYFLKIRENAQYKAVARQIESMDEKELRGLLVRYFAADFCDYMRGNHKKKKKFVFLLDTVESMRYQILRNNKNEDYLEWLAGSNGLFRLLPDCLWMLFGREKIPWQNYDSEWTSSFVCREFPKPSKAAVREYLLRLLGNASLSDHHNTNPAARTGTPEETAQLNFGAESAILERTRLFGKKLPKEANRPMQETAENHTNDETDLYTLIEEIIQQTECYSLAIENSVDVYFRIWNENLRKNRVTDKYKVNSYRPLPSEMQEIFLDKKGKKIISNRFLQYYTLQEREVWYTLVCLEIWTDEILETLIWKRAVHNTLIYEEICATSFISTGNNGQKSIQGLMPNIIMEECPLSLKKQLFYNIMALLKDRDLDSSYWLLLQSAIHIGSFYPLESAAKQLLGTEFVRTAIRLNDLAQFYRLSFICEKLLHMADYEERKNLNDTLASSAQRNVDEDLYLAALIGKYFARVFQKENAEEELRLLRTGTCFDVFSLQLATALLDTAQEIHAFSQAYELADFLSNHLRTQTLYENRDQAGYYLYLLLRTKLESMLQLDGCFENADIEEELQHFCELTRQIFSANPKLAEMENAELWAKYCRKYISREFASQQIKNGIKQYRAYCTEEEAAYDVNLCVMEVEAMKITGCIVLCDINQKALKGIRILDKIYGEAATEQPSMYSLMISTFISVGLPPEDIALYRKVFASYYEQFYKKGDWDAYSIVRFGCIQSGLAQDADEGCELVPLSDLLASGILYLSNLASNDIQNQLRLLLCYGLMSNAKDWIGRNDSSAERTQRLILNNRMLMYFLQKLTEQAEQSEDSIVKERLLVLLKVLFEDKINCSCYSPEEQKHLLGLLELCGMDIRRTLWVVEYREDAKNEFNLLKVLQGWQWQIDIQTDIWMLDTVLHVLWHFREMCDPVQEHILDLLKEYPKKPELKAAVWLGILENASMEGNDWELHIRELFQEISKSLRPNDLDADTRNKLSKYDSRFASDDSAEADKGNPFNAFETELKSYMKSGDYDTAFNMLRTQYQKQQNHSKTLNRSVFFTEDIFVQFYLPVVRNRGTDRFVEALQEENFTVLVKDHYSALRAHAYAGDQKGFISHYQANRRNIWLDFKYSPWIDVEGEFLCMAPFIQSMGDTELLHDYLEQATEVSILRRRYTKGILSYIKYITEYIPFRKIWKQESCIKEINQNNYTEIYKYLHEYLPSDELADTFIAAVRNFVHEDKDLILDVDITFLESSYYQWLKATFHDEVDDRMKEKFPRLYEAMENYENYQRDSYRWQIHKAATELKSILRKS